MRSFLNAGLAISALVAVAIGCASNSRRTTPVAAPMVTAQDIENQPGVPIEQILEAKIPGIAVTRTADGGIAIQIRGTNSFYANTFPLYVIDGVELAGGHGGALTGVNPYDIESIKVLKNPEDTGLYGVRGANGVIVITTKRPGGKHP